ncbi:MAG: hypothetical protein LBI68_07635 [Azoarcus sp.]|jgi:hypothetical protein|nr:hypothetical protein [Azoarcus sp.]
MQYWKFFIGVAALSALAGCGDDSVSKKTGSSISGAVVDFASGLGQGVDEKMLVVVEADSTLVDKGLTATLGKDRGTVDNQSTVYIVSEKPFKGVLSARALDKDDNEIGRAQTDIDLKEDDAAYVDFQFPGQMDSKLVRKYRISVRS